MKEIIPSKNNNLKKKKEISVISSKLVEKYKFSNQYFESPKQLKEDILNKTIIPHQVEFQPGPQGKKICWLSCPYCYGEISIR